jgi:hypothetical protein
MKYQLTSLSGFIVENTYASVGIAQGGKHQYVVNFFSNS